MVVKARRRIGFTSNFECEFLDGRASSAYYCPCCDMIPAEREVALVWRFDREGHPISQRKHTTCGAALTADPLICVGACID